MSTAVRRLGASLCTFVILCVVAEIAGRAFLSEEELDDVVRLRHVLLTGSTPEFEPRAHTIFQRPRTGGWANSFGFNDLQWSREPQSGVPRILCLGSSTTEGGNSSGRPGTYPFQLEEVLQQRTGRDFEVMNAGVSGWTTAEILVSWFLTLKDFRPDVVVLHEGANDLWPRFLANFEPDYSHWRKPVQIPRLTVIEHFLVSWSRLYLHLRMRGGKVPDMVELTSESNGPREPEIEQGTLPRETSLPFRRNVLEIAHSAQESGCTVVLMTMPQNPNANVSESWRYGVRENNQTLRELAREQGCLLADAEEVFGARPQLAAEFLDFVHLSSGGNLAKAEIVADALAGWIAGLESDGAREPRTEPNLESVSLLPPGTPPGTGARSERPRARRQ